MLAGAREQARACYMRVLYGGYPSAQGALRIHTQIASDGRVTEVCVGATGTLPDTILPCVGTVLAALRFEPPEGGSATLDGSFSFVNTTCKKYPLSCPPP